MRNVLYACFMLALTPVFGQSDLTVGASHSLNIQKQGDHEDAFILHNAQFATMYPTFSWKTTHPSFGSRGIRFSYTDGIHFYADNSPTTANAVFTPTAKFFIGNNGNVGIGTTSPNARLSVNGNIQISNAMIPMGLMTEVGGFTPLLNMSVNFRETNKDNSYRGAAFRIDSREGMPLFQWLKRDAGSSTEIIPMVLTQNGLLGVGTTAPRAKVDINHAGGQLSLSGGSLTGGLWTNQTNLMYLANWDDGQKGLALNMSTGNVGIGTFSPDQRLTVNGKIHASEVIIDTSIPTPDYVFEENYSLTPLDEIKVYITQHKHLPEVPSAKEIQKGGLKVGEMEMILLKKVEEITLYLIESKEQVKQLQEENAQQKAEIRRLSKKVQSLNK